VGLEPTDLGEDILVAEDLHGASDTFPTQVAFGEVEQVGLGRRESFSQSGDAFVRETGF
jgi:hypothetical protein